MMEEGEEKGRFKKYSKGEEGERKTMIMMVEEE